MDWVRFFVGTPRRFLATMVVPMMIFAYFRPDIIQTSLHNLLEALLLAVAPFVEPLMVLAVVCIGLGMMLRGVWSGGKKK